MVSVPNFELLKELQQLYGQDSEIQVLMLKFKKGELRPKYSIQSGLLYCKDKPFIVNNQPFKLKLFELFHSSPTRGHLGYDKTLHRIRREFYFPKLRKEVKEFILICDICQCMKHQNHLLGGFLQPLEISSKPWSNISMDFIEGLPLSHAFNCPWVVVDHLTKFNHFIPLSHLP